MPSWSALLEEFDKQDADQAKTLWFLRRLDDFLMSVANRRGTNVVIYSSGFLQKPMVPSAVTSINREDINGFMSCMHQLDFERGLTLIVHTPGGEMAAVETIVDYLRSKFQYIETIVPVYAMSGGTMIALGSELVVMGRQSQLGPIDAQMPLTTGFVSASSIIGQFNITKAEISEDHSAALVWGPILQAMGPSLLQQAQNAVALGQQMAEQWLETYMFKDSDDPKGIATQIAAYFNSEEVHLNHGRRIGVEECAAVGLKIERLEADQGFQDDVLSVYHLLTIAFEQSPAVKVMRNQHGRSWIKSFDPRGGSA